MHINFSKQNGAMDHSLCTWSVCVCVLCAKNASPMKVHDEATTTMHFLKVKCLSVFANNSLRAHTHTHTQWQTHMRIAITTQTTWSRKMRIAEFRGYERRGRRSVWCLGWSTVGTHTHTKTSIWRSEPPWAQPLLIDSSMCGECAQSQRSSAHDCSHHRRGYSISEWPYVCVCVCVSANPQNKYPHYTLSRYMACDGVHG